MSIIDDYKKSELGLKGKTPPTLPPVDKDSSIILTKDSQQDLDRKTPSYNYKDNAPDGAHL